MLLFTILIMCSFLYTSAGPLTTYDQRQTGDLNVQIDLKNLKIFALMKGGKEEYVDYDYAYDYSEMTIKPTNGTTPKPLNATVTVVKDNTTNSNSSASTSIEFVQTIDSIIKNSTNPTPLSEAVLSQHNYTVNETTSTTSAAIVKTTMDIETTSAPEIMIAKDTCRQRNHKYNIVGCRKREEALSSRDGDNQKLLDKIN